ncbi:helix-turn-helix domain-containing protein [Nocardioides sp. Bht2]|uniref:helix-turn-helix domain-containing protein n=1 Tax=Nocardioides sp. Bht2 TaxID=3392297 RepID=UPI0039B6986D
MTTCDDEAVGVALRVLRKAAGMTLNDVSRVAGVSPAYLSNVENGNVRPSAPWVHAVLGSIGSEIQAERQAA